MSTPKRSATYLLRMTDDEKANMETRAKALGEPLSDVLRNGGDLYLTKREDGEITPPSTLEERVARLERQINDRHFGGKE